MIDEKTGTLYKNHNALGAGVSFLVGLIKKEEVFDNHVVLLKNDRD